MVGAENFTLIGRPLLDPRLVNVHATVIEKSTTSPEVIYNPKIQKPDSVRCKILYKTTRFSKSISLLLTVYNHELNWLIV